MRAVSRLLLGWLLLFSMKPTRSSGSATTTVTLFPQPFLLLGQQPLRQLHVRLLQLLPWLLLLHLLLQELQELRRDLLLLQLLLLLLLQAQRGHHGRRNGLVLVGLGGVTAAAAAAAA